MPKMRAWIGTSGFSYPEWKGIFYPRELPNKKMLAFYGTHLPAVEINNTFYRMPRPELFQGWLSEVPEEFRFAIKAPRRITHQMKLSGAAETTRYLYETCKVLGDRLGVILFQLPPFLKKDLVLLEEFLASLPEACTVAFEFRNSSWFDDAVYAALQSRNAALCGGDLDDAAKSPPLVRTATHGYLRLRRTAYTEADLAVWAERIRELELDCVHGFFKHEEQGPALAAALIERLGE